jgi:hypothetical protein
MEQVWVLPAIPAVLFIILALFHPLLPRRGDFIAIAGMLVVLVLVVVMLVDFQRHFANGLFVPNGSHVFSFDWINIQDGFYVIEFSTFFDAITAVMLPVRWTPASPLPAMRLRAAAVVPPIRLPGELCTRIPCWRLPRAAVPAGSAK